MIRIVSAAILLAAVIGATAPAFAISEYTNCSSAPKADFARCVIRQSKGGGE